MTSGTSAGARGTKAAAPEGRSPGTRRRGRPEQRSDGSTDVTSSTSDDVEAGDLPGAASRRWLIWAVAAAAVSFVLGVAGFARYGSPPHRPLDVVYHTLQLFVLGSDPLAEGPPLPWQLEVARILAPLTTVYAVFESLRKLWRDDLMRRRVARRTGHTVVCGNDIVSRVLARNLHAAGLSVVRVEPGTGSTSVERIGVAVVRGDARDRTTLEAAGVQGADTVYACATGSSDNAAVALAAARLCRDLAKGAPRLRVFAQVADEDLVQALRVRQLAAPGRWGAQIDFFAVDSTAARVLLATSTVGEAGTVAVTGSGPFIPALLRALVRAPRPGGARREVTVHTDDPGAVDELALRFDVAGRGTELRVAARDSPIEVGTELVVVCERDDETTLGTALRLQRSPGRDVVACLRRADPFAVTLAGTERLTTFGILDGACRESSIAEDAIFGRAARAVHRNYVESCRAAGDTTETNSSMVDWEELPAYLQESNYAQAEHISVKLAELPAMLTTVPPTQEFAFEGDEVIRLAKLEHRRWMDERRASGFTWGAVRDATHHPDLVDWPNLSNDSRQKDVAAVEQLPGLLGAAGLYITRL